MTNAPEPSLIVIFGGTGDLARRKLLPAVARLAHGTHLPPGTQILGVAREQMDDAGFRAFVAEALTAAKVPPEVTKALCNSCLHYQTIGSATPAEFQALANRIATLEAAHGLPGNRAFYLALPPQVFASTIQGLGAVGLNQSAGWTRLIIEKPFGHDLASAHELNELVHAVYREDQIYRIDHYLGKETVQNLMVLRFANTIFESIWNRDRVESVQITVMEELGVGSRANYYDKSGGAIRDMLQNHLTQLLTLVAMEIPSAYEADAIRYEKIKVLRSTRRLDPTRVVRGRYLGNGKVPGYLEEEGIPVTSTTETFVALELFIDNWRWQGVPFYLRTGKRMGKSLSQIAVRLRPSPAALFNSFLVKHETADTLIISLQPDSGFSLHFDVKVPGNPFRTERIPLDFRYAERFAEIPEAYETLLLDVLEGDQTLFVHADEVEQSWKLYTPILEAPTPLHEYVAGSWGPDGAAHLAIPDADLWQESWKK